MYLLDTDHCSRLIEGDAGVTGRLAALRESLVATSIIARGELLFMAQRSGQPGPNLAKVRALLAGLYLYLLDEETADCYGELKASLLPLSVLESELLRTAGRAGQGDRTTRGLTRALY